MSKYWSKRIHDLQPYVPGEQPKISGLVKLNTNENPFGPSPEVLAALSAGIGDRLRLYPDPTSLQLRETIASYHAVAPEQVFVGNGSDEILAHLFHALLQHDQPVLFPDITYSFYPVYCRLYDIDYRPVPLDPDFRIRVSDYAGPNGGIIVPNPNAPTGIALDLQQVEELVANCPDSVVAIDEAYIDFGGSSAMTLVNRYPNLLVIQTLSKSRSLAGLRVGFAVGQRDLIEALERVKDSFNSYPLGMLAQIGAIAAIKDERYFRHTCQQVMANREVLVKGLQQRGFTVLPSVANFLFATHPQQSAGGIYKELYARGVLVRHFNKLRIEQWLRVSIGTEEQHARLLAALDDFL